MTNHYRIGYHDSLNKHKDLYIDADNAWDAKNKSASTNTYLNDHPHSIDYVLIDLN